MEHHKMNVGQGLQNTSQTSRVFNPYPSFCSAMQPSLKPLPPSHVGGMTFYQLEEFVDLSLRMMIEEAAVFDNQVKEVNRRDMVIRNNALQLQEVAALFIHFSETVYMLEKEEYFIQYYLGVLELALNSVVEPRSIAPYMSASNDAEFYSLAVDIYIKWKHIETDAKQFKIMVQDSQSKSTNDPVDILRRLFCINTRNFTWIEERIEQLVKLIDYLNNLYTCFYNEHKHPNVIIKLNKNRLNNFFC